MKTFFASTAIAIASLSAQGQTLQPTHIEAATCSDHVFTTTRTLAQDHDDVLACTKDGASDSTPVCIAKKRSMERVVFFDDHCNPNVGPFAIGLNGSIYTLQRASTSEARSVAFENEAEKLRVQMTMKGPAEREYVTGKRGKLIPQDKAQPVHIHVNKDGSESFFEAKLVEKTKP